MDSITNFLKKKDYLICIDSDGCAMDTMDIKHIQSFGPSMVSKWGLEPWQQPVLNRWNEINLYSMTRGINRFKGLAIALKEINDTYCDIDGCEAFLTWTGAADELSEPSVEAQWNQSGKEIFKKALNWSQEVNVSIDQLAGDFKKPFPGVLEGLREAHAFADVSIVSSANAKAVKEEWEAHGLVEYVDIALTQESGSKACCIGKMKEKGYLPKHVLMVGDAPGDQQAAAENGVHFYPILVKKEEESWKRFAQEAIHKFLDGSYTERYQAELICEFENNLKGRI